MCRVVALLLVCYDARSLLPVRWFAKRLYEGYLLFILKCSLQFYLIEIVNRRRGFPSRRPPRGGRAVKRFRRRRQNKNGQNPSGSVSPRLGGSGSSADKPLAR